MIHRNTIISILLIAICLGTGGCLGQADAVRPRPDLLWPNPPETGRIRFVRTVSEPADLNIKSGMLRQFVRYMAGRPAASIGSPSGVSSDARGRLYVADTFLKRVHVFDAGENTYSYFPEDRTMLASPVDIAADQSGLMYVTDSKKGVVHVFGDQGRKRVSEFGRGLFKRPTGIAVNEKTSELLVVDTLQSRVFRYDLSTMREKGSFGGQGTADGCFHYPTHIFVTSAGHIIVSDSLNFRVQVFSPEGRFLNRFGGMGQEPGAFSRPKGVAADSDGHIYVVDALFDNIQVFDETGRLLMAFGDHGTGDGQFWLPAGIHIDENDYIYVADSSNKRVQVFKYLKEDVLK